MAVRRYIRWSLLGFTFLVGIHVFIMWNRTPLSILNELPLPTQNHNAGAYSHGERSFAEIYKAVANGALSVRDGGILMDSLFLNQQIPSNRSLHFPSLSDSEKKHFPLFPFESNNNDDRIINQMRYVPKQFVQSRKVVDKLILFHCSPSLKDCLRGKLQDMRHCPVQACEFTNDISTFNKSHAVVWQSDAFKTLKSRPSSQTWIFAANNPNQLPVSLMPSINWTSSYLHSSTIVSPFFKFIPYNLDATRGNQKPVLRMPLRNYAKGKSKKVVWFVNDCQNDDNHRMQYAHELAKHIEVDIYGSCGTHHCSLSKSRCFEMFKENYKFYLSFESSSCRDYITEEFFQNALQNDLIPIVLGAHPDDYARAAPYHSYIHVDEFASPQELAKFLYYIDKNDSAFNTYFAWKSSGFISDKTYFLCRLCMMVHEEDNIRKDMQIKKESETLQTSCSKTRWVSSQTVEQHVAKLSQN